MSISQSKLMLQLSKQQQVRPSYSCYSQQKLQQLYLTTSKLQQKNLTLSQFLCLLIQKNLLRNSFKLQTFASMYQQTKDKNLQQHFNNKKNTSPNSNITGDTNLEENRFNKGKFLKLLRDVARVVYPGDANASQGRLYQRLVLSESEDNRVKIDDGLRRLLNQEVVQVLGRNNRELETLFQLYMPENYNRKLGFQWNQIKLLEKKLPMTCLLRILFEAEICPQSVSQIQVLQILSKMIPPLNSNHKEVMFYHSETFNNYMRQHIFSEQIKLLEGDIGLTFFEFQMIIVKIATQFCKENKQEFSKYVEKFIGSLNITQIIKTKKYLPRMTKLQSVVLTYFKDLQKSPSSYSNKPSLKKENMKKRQREELKGLVDETDQQLPQKKPLKKLQQESIQITKDWLQKIKRNLDDQLSPVPQKKPIDKQNQGYFNPNQKFTVIGQPLPKLQQKGKPPGKRTPKQDPLLGFKPEQPPQPSLLLTRKRKLRLNTEYPVILSEVFYQTSFSDPGWLQFGQEQQVLLETTYIHLGERMHEEAYRNFQKARRLLVGLTDKRKTLLTEFYMQILEAQIFQAAGKDQAALVHYYSAREISFNLPVTELRAKAVTYIGISSALYHLQEYQFALRCLLKAKQVYGDSLAVESIDNAILLNNISSCYMMLNRNQEAVRTFNLSHQIFDLRVGRFDQRTLIVQQNISKNKKAFIDQMPSYKTMWKTYVQKNTNLSTVKTAKKTNK